MSKQVPLQNLCTDLGLSWLQKDFQQILVTSEEPPLVGGWSKVH